MRVVAKKITAKRGRRGHAVQPCCCCRRFVVERRRQQNMFVMLITRYAKRCVVDSTQRQYQRFYIGVFTSELLRQRFFNVTNQYLVFRCDVTCVALDDMAATVDQILVEIPLG